jgi:hypothetical protein
MLAIPSAFDPDHPMLRARLGNQSGVMTPSVKTRLACSQSVQKPFVHSGQAAARRGKTISPAE